MLEPLIILVGILFCAVAILSGHFAAADPAQRNRQDVGLMLTGFLGMAGAVVVVVIEAVYLPN